MKNNLKEKINLLESITRKKVKLIEARNAGISLSDDFGEDEFDDIDTRLKAKGFKSVSIEDAINNHSMPDADFKWWIAQGDDMPHGISIFNPAILKTEEYRELLSYKGKNIYS